MRGRGREVAGPTVARARSNQSSPVELVQVDHRAAALLSLAVLVRSSAQEEERGYGEPCREPGRSHASRERSSSEKGFVGGDAAFRFRGKKKVGRNDCFSKASSPPSEPRPKDRGLAKRTEQRRFCLVSLLQIQKRREAERDRETQSERGGTERSQSTRPHLPPGSSPASSRATPSPTRSRPAPPASASGSSPPGHRYE